MVQVLNLKHLQLCRKWPSRILNVPLLWSGHIYCSL